MQPLKIGVIGAGGIATNVHLPSLTQIDRAQVAAVCDCAPGRAEEAARRFGVPAWYENYRQMLQAERLDAVYVLTQPDQLYRVVVDVLAAGKHVFMEKPMGITLFQAESIAEHAAAANRCVYVGYNRRYIPLVAEALDRMRQLTAINHVSGCFYKDSSPSFYDGCASAFECDVIHVIDLIRHMAGCDSAQARTLQAQPDQGGPAYAWYGVMRFANGVTADLRANYRTGARVHNFELHGPQASAYLTLGFGGAQCQGYILHSVGPQSHSQSVNGAAQTEVIALDGRQLAQSADYWRYYGYYAESEAFISRVLAHPQEGHPERLAADLASVRLMEQLRQPVFGP